MKYKNCLNCGKKVSKNCRLGYCNNCRNRSGKNNPFYGKKHTKETIDKIKEVTSLASIEKWKDKEYRNKVIKAVSKPRRKGFKKEQSERIKKWFDDNPIQKDIRRKKMKQSWKDGKIEPNINSINESKFEKDLLKELQERLPNLKIRKRTIRINGKWFYPDISIENNVIIEFFGNYWHANPKIFKDTDIVHHKIYAKDIWKFDKERIEILEKEGFRVFIVWQDLYQLDKEKVIKELIEKL